MSSYSQTSHFPKLKNSQRNDKNLNRVNLMPRNLSQTQFLRTLSALAKQNRKPILFYNYNKLQKLNLWKTFKTICVQRERETDDDYENKTDNNFHPSA